MDTEVVLHKGYYWPKKDGSMEITSEYAHTDSTCFNLMNHYKDVPDNVAQKSEKRNVMVQAGGNAGFYVKRYSELFDKVYTFEPDPVNFYCLNLNVTSPNVYKFQAFLGNEHKCQKLINTYAYMGHGGSHVDYNSIGDTPTLRIDDLNLMECNLIHLDIEGYEQFALLGAVETIKRCKPVICIENFEQWKMRYNSSLSAVEFMLSELSYKRVCKIDGDEDLVYKYFE